jgi:hypothetical protein
LSVQKLELHPIEATSPSLAEVMRSCFLRVGLSKISGSSSFVLGNPKSWLGVAYHDVLEKLFQADLAIESLDMDVDRLWNQAIMVQHRRATGHPLDRRFGSPETWPGYHLSRASVFLRAKDLVCRHGFAIGLSKEKRASAFNMREQQLVACGGKLVGRPDVITDDEIIDYKSSAITEYEEATQSEIVKTAFVRQLRIYGFLVKEVLARRPQRGILFPLAGSGVEIGLDPVDCEQEALEAVTLLDCYNSKFHSGAALADFASPSHQKCKWCAYKLICPPFWQSASPAWSGQLEGATIEGTVSEAPRVIHDGTAIMISLDVQRGSEVLRQVSISPLNPAVHADITEIAPGEQIRMIGLHVRQDGSLAPGQRTVLMRVVCLPSVEVNGGKNQGKWVH